LIPVFIKMRASYLYFLLISTIASPLDIITLANDFIGAQYSFLSNLNVDTIWTLGLGSVLRPIENFILFIVIITEYYVRKTKNRVAHSNSG
jgi:hypothetical protein